MEKILIRGVIYCLLMVVTLYTAVLYASAGILLLFFVEAILFVALLVIYIPTARRMQVRLRIPMPIVEQGSRVPVQIAAWNDDGRAGRIEVQITSCYPLKQRKSKTRFFCTVSDPEAQKCILETEYRPDCTGSMRLQISGVWCYDLFGILRLPVPKAHWKQLEPEQILFLPQIHPVPVSVSRQSRDFAGDCDEHAQDRGGDDPSEVFQIREYRPGDKMCSIHWKLSAKADDWMVCEQSLPLGCPVTFYLDLHAAGRGIGRGISRTEVVSQKKTGDRNEKGRSRQIAPGGKARLTDSFLQVAASVSQGLILGKCRHFIAWYDCSLGDIRRRRIEKEEDLYDLLIMLGSLETYREPFDLKELYRQKYKDAPCITTLTLNLRLELTRNGEKEIVYTERGKALGRALTSHELRV